MRAFIGAMTAIVAVFGITGLAHAGDAFVATLSGTEEVPPVETMTRGRALVVFNEDETAADFLLQVRDGERITQAHIHCAPKGVNGPVVAFLAGLNPQGYHVDGILPWISGATLVDASVIPRTSDECPTAINNLRELAQTIRAGNAYVNVHSFQHSSGVIRGQLFSK
jgi:hypothetical protein